MGECKKTDKKYESMRMIKWYVQYGVTKGYQTTNIRLFTNYP